VAFCGVDFPFANEWTLRMYSGRREGYSNQEMFPRHDISLPANRQTIAFVASLFTITILSLRWLTLTIDPATPIKGFE
jgi:hypothetical protein